MTSNTFVIDIEYIRQRLKGLDLYDQKFLVISHEALSGIAPAGVFQNENSGVSNLKTIKQCFPGYKITPLVIKRAKVPFRKSYYKELVRMGLPLSADLFERFVEGAVPGVRSYFIAQKLDPDIVAKHIRSVYPGAHVYDLKQVFIKGSEQNRALLKLLRIEGEKEFSARNVSRKMNIEKKVLQNFRKFNWLAQSVPSGLMRRQAKRIPN